jgi:hypothetical protein
VALSGCLTACGGGSSGSAGSSGDAPTDASKDDFCGTLKGSGSDVKPSEVATKLKSVGTPSNIDASARQGFEVLVDKMSQLDSSNPSDADIAKLSQDFKAADLTDVQAFISYYVKECAGDLQGSDGGS